MFGAYQAGAWHAIAERFPPALVAGVSIGALNGYLIASGLNPDQLADRWLDLQDFARLRFRVPWNPLEGCVDASRLEQLLRTIASECTPRLPLIVLATEILPPRLRVFGPGGITWRHLAASCALLGILPQYRIDGRRHSDGGLLCGLPIDAAAAHGATRIIAVNCLPRMPLPIRGSLQVLRRIARDRRPPATIPDIVTVTPARPLGSLRDAACWNRDNVLRWIEQGRRDAEAALVGCSPMPDAAARIHTGLPEQS
jgi:predicted acylesterase/phospholipase RssA